MGWVLDYSARSADGNATSSTAESRYLIDFPVDPVAVRRFPQTFLGGFNGSEPLPAYGSPHPNDPSLRLDVYSVRQNGVVSEVLARYSTDGRFQPPPIPTTQTDTIVGYSSRHYDVIEKIPYGVLVDSVTTFPVAAGVGPPERFVQPIWMLKQQEVREERRERSWQVLITYEQIAAAESIMDAQSGRLHNIFGTWYQYKASDVVQTSRRQDPNDPNSERLYMITHTWTNDRGTDLIPSSQSSTGGPFYYTSPWSAGLGRFSFVVFADSNLLSVGPPTRPGAIGWLRPPFHITNISPSNDPNEPPERYLVLPNAVDADGWLQLPGVV